MASDVAVGDWVVDWFGNVAKVIDISDEGPMLRVVGRLGITGARFERQYSHGDRLTSLGHLRHLLPEEVRDGK